MQYSKFHVFNFIFNEGLVRQPQSTVSKPIESSSCNYALFSYMNKFNLLYLELQNLFFIISFFSSLFLSAFFSIFSPPFLFPLFFCFSYFTSFVFFLLLFLSLAFFFWLLLPFSFSYFLLLSLTSFFFLLLSFSFSYFLFLSLTSFFLMLLPYSFSYFLFPSFAVLFPTSPCSSPLSSLPPRRPTSCINNKVRGLSWPELILSLNRIYCNIIIESFKTWLQIDAGKCK